MSVLDEAEQLLRTMTRAEKAQLLQWVAREGGDEGLRRRGHDVLTTIESGRANQSIPNNGEVHGNTTR